MLFSVKIIPGSKKNLVSVVSETRLMVEVKEVAKKNEANRRAVALIAEHFNLELGKVKIVRGHHRPQKIVSVGGDSLKL